jgi:hypothetical protein
MKEEEGSTVSPRIFTVSGKVRKREAGLDDCAGTGVLPLSNPLKAWRPQSRTTSSL